VTQKSKENKKTKNADLPSALQIKTKGQARRTKQQAIEWTKNEIVEGVRLIAFNQHFPMTKLTKLAHELTEIEKGKWDSSMPAVKAEAVPN